LICGVNSQQRKREKAERHPVGTGRGWDDQRRTETVEDGRKGNHVRRLLVSKRTSGLGGLEP